jgi:uncharacterized protein
VVGDHALHGEACLHGGAAGVAVKSRCRGEGGGQASGVGAQVAGDAVVDDLGYGPAWCGDDGGERPDPIGTSASRSGRWSLFSCGRSGARWSRVLCVTTDWRCSVSVQTWLIDISARECEDLLATTALGRLGVVVDGRPEVFPVNHVFDRDSGCVVFPTKSGAKLNGALNWPTVAFEVDGIVADVGGWSVAVVGRAEEIIDVDEIERVSRLRKVLWAAGAGTRWIRIVPEKVSGRRISAVVHASRSAQEA